MEDWFVSWFNSPYYHILYKDRNQEEAAVFIDALVAHLNVPKGARVLDLACGKGRHSLRLRKAGLEVIGIDLSEESIEQAKTLEKDGLEFYVHDMRNLYWADYFDLVVNLFTSFGYFHSKDDDLKMIRSVSDSLKARGLFVLDFMNVTKVKKTLVDFEEKTIDGIRFELNRSSEGGMIKKSIHIVDGETELDFEESVDALELEDFEQYFEEAGLEFVSLFGDYQLGPFNENTSDRLIMVTQKKIG